MRVQSLPYKPDAQWRHLNVLERRSTSSSLYRFDNSVLRAASSLLIYSLNQLFYGLFPHSSHTDALHSCQHCLVLFFEMAFSQFLCNTLCHKTPPNYVHSATLTNCCVCACLHVYTEAYYSYILSCRKAGVRYRGWTCASQQFLEC